MNNKEDVTTLATSNKTATITWNLEDNWMEVDFKRSLKADDLCGAIFDFQNYLRELQKYDSKPEDSPLIDTIRDKFYSILEEHDINIDEIYQ